MVFKAVSSDRPTNYALNSLLLLLLLLVLLLLVLLLLLLLLLVLLVLAPEGRLNAKLNRARLNRP